MKRGTHPVAQLPARSPRPALRVVRCNHRLPQAPLGIAVDQLQRHRAQIREPTAKREIGEGFDGRTLATPPAERRPRRRQREPQLVRQNRQSLARRRKAVLAPIAGPVLQRAEIAGKRTASAALLQDRLAQPLDRVGVKLVKANLHGPICRLGRSLSQLWTGVRPGAVPLARLARGLTENAEEWLKDEVLRTATEHRARIEESLPERRLWIARGYDHKTAELMAQRRRVSGEARRGDAGAQAELAVVREEQRRLVAEKRRALALLDGESSQIEPGETTMIAHALVVPTHDPEERQRHDADVEAIAMDLARAHEEAAGAAVRDVSRPALARREGLSDWPGFDLRSLRPAGAHGLAEDRAVEVKGRAETGAVEVSENEWAAACNLRDRYWLYVVFDCATPRPRLVKVRDPFGRLLATAKGIVVIAASEIISASTGEMGA